MRALSRLVPTSASSMSSATAPRPSQIVLYEDANGMNAAVTRDRGVGVGHRRADVQGQEHQDEQRDVAVHALGEEPRPAADWRTGPR